MIRRNEPLVSGDPTIDEYRTALQKCVADKASDWKAACESAELASKEIARLRLTRYERHCLKEVRDIYADEDDVACNEIAAVLDALLERTAPVRGKTLPEPPEVK